MSNSLISVIIPAYNCSKLIPNAIESVLGQTYSNLELIVVDDGSTDNTAEIILNYKNYNNNMKYIYQNNGGVSKARNTGIKQSVGEYIAFLDADDIWDKNKLEIQMKVINNCKNIDMIFSSFKNTKNNKIVVILCCPSIISSLLFFCVKTSVPRKYSGSLIFALISSNKSVTFFSSHE